MVVFCHVGARHCHYCALKCKKKGLQSFRVFRIAGQHCPGCPPPPQGPVPRGWEVAARGPGDGDGPPPCGERPSTPGPPHHCPSTPPVPHPAAPAPSPALLARPGTGRSAPGRGRRAEHVGPGPAARRVQLGGARRGEAAVLHRRPVLQPGALQPREEPGARPLPARSAVSKWLARSHCRAKVLHIELVDKGHGCVFQRSAPVSHAPSKLHETRRLSSRSPSPAVASRLAMLGATPGQDASASRPTLTARKQYVCIGVSLFDEERLRRTREESSEAESNRASRIAVLRRA